ncbi:hypothetical protein [Ruminiclostridium papyrosolvens]|uniref:Uncharacterized protein n=1 Tax=Ruminiclostridium papyrosolvens C7 TaxID=1330534 RepID=U4R362_9FIRM|nr:hypothetical protein [Ruminiclostridium papyrosolvens]EPR12044.1 hypothetical protein L323_09835 [Ruminiclostridium papyrosolvens C7]
MTEFSLKEYRKNPQNAKEKVFFEFLFERFGGLAYDDEEFDSELFTIFDEEHLIESFEYYIAKNHITSQQTAENYITNITTFFDMLSNDYNIKNEIFVNKELYKSFLLKTKYIISKLNETKSKDVATSEQYEVLNYYIDNFLKTLSIEDIYDEINKFYDKKYSKKKVYIKSYNRFVSSIATKLVMKYALANRNIAYLELKDLDLNYKILHVNGFELPLDDQLTNLLQEYIKIREQVLNIHSKQKSTLFIKADGEQYTFISRNEEHVDCTRLFKIMKDCTGGVASDLYASKRILEMLDKRIDMSIVSNLSGRTTDKCQELFVSNLSGGADRLIQFLKQEDEIIPKKVAEKQSDYIRCPFCGREKNAISEEWILVQFEKDGKKYIACKGCKGNNGKFRL